MPQQSKTVTDNAKSLPRQHIVVVASLFLALGAITLNPTPKTETSWTTIPLDIDLSSPAGIANDPAALEAEHQPWQELVVRSGDSLSSLFSRAGIKATELANLLDSNKEIHDLKKLTPGDKIEVQLEDSTLVGVKFQPNKLKTVEFVRNAEGFDASVTERTPEVHTRFTEATVQSSLFLAGQAAGLSQTTTLELANIFGGDIDFVNDPRKGDTFSILFEELYVEGEKVGNGAILAARYVNQGEEHVAYRYTDRSGKVGYYNSDGESLRKAFLRAPLDFTRVSSGFNMARFHPILKIVRPHRGIDYSAPTGTPVYAAGDGRIVQSGFSASMGNFVVIQHGSGYMTKYLHLSKRMVNGGQRVSQGQTIGRVGSTGYATGSHLHYEFLVNGVHQNPSKALGKMPQAEHLAGAEKARFNQQIAGLKLQLETHGKDHQLAQLQSR